MKGLAMKTRPKPKKESSAAPPVTDRGETLPEKISRYCTSEFASSVTRHFHQAKRKALAERDAAASKDQNRSA
jgi:hypothetical protein